MAPFEFDALVSGPTLFTGIGAFIWVPLSLAIGRRPAFLLACLLLTAATLWAGVTDNFYQLFVALCLVGVAEGFSTSAVRISSLPLPLNYISLQILRY
jgi:MFS family permease